MLGKEGEKENKENVERKWKEFYRNWTLNLIK